MSEGQESGSRYIYGHCFDEKELWCQIFEKAYAKLYGNYLAIDGGFVSSALSDLTGGLPVLEQLSDYKNRLEQLWNTLHENNSNGYLMGAGSHQHPQGDKHSSDNGIVNSHAYAVLDVQEWDSNRLVKLRNPHGQHGVEWNGNNYYFFFFFF